MSEIYSCNSSLEVNDSPTLIESSKESATEPVHRNPGSDLPTAASKADQHMYEHTVNLTLDPTDTEMRRLAAKAGWAKRKQRAPSKALQESTSVNAYY